MNGNGKVWQWAMSVAMAAILALMTLSWNSLNTSMTEIRAQQLGNTRLLAAVEAQLTDMRRRLDKSPYN